MKGTRPLNNAEIEAVSAAFEGTFAIRNRSLFMLGVSIGGRIDELLSLTVGDVWQHGKPVTDVLYNFTQQIASLTIGTYFTYEITLNAKVVFSITESS